MPELLWAHLSPAKDILLRNKENEITDSHPGCWHSPPVQPYCRQRASVTISATAASENASIVDVRYYANGELLGTNNAAPYAFVWKNMSAGKYTLKVEAIDNAGNTASDEVTLSIAPAPAVISLRAGWNLVGCPLTGATPIDIALASIWDNVAAVKNETVFYDAAAGALSSLKVLEFGKGYYVNVAADCDLYWKQ